MRLSERYHRVNLLAVLVVLLFTGVIYYAMIHFILTEKLDKDLGVEENEIKAYVFTFHKLPLPVSYQDQQVIYRKLNAGEATKRKFKYTNYYNPKENETEPGRSLNTTVQLRKERYEVTITKSRVESEDLVKIILFITLGISGLLLISLVLINRFILNRLWEPFYTILAQMKKFNVLKMHTIEHEPCKIDEFNELNLAANAMAARVGQDYKELKNFTDNASHEIMTPLAVINSKLDTLLQTESFSPQQGALLEDIYAAIGRLSRLNQSLLLLAKIENNLIPDLQEINLQEMVSQKTRQFQELYKKNTLNLDEDLYPLNVRMSRYLADILLNNLLSNAIRHNYPGGSIAIKLNSRMLQIVNTGKSPELDKQLFERFSKSPTSEGMGLGLAITKQICALYGFSLEYKHQEGKHSFSISFNA